MSIVIAAFSIFLLILSKYIIKDKISLFCLNSFILYWGISLFITCFNPMQMSDINPQTHFILLFAMLGFCMGSYFYNYFIKSYNFYTPNKKLIDETRIYCSSLSFNALYIFSTILLLHYAVRALVFAELNGGTIEYEERVETVFEGSKYAQMYMDFIASPLSYATFALLGISMLKPCRKIWKFYILAPIFLISYLIIAGGRSIFVTGAMIIMITIVCIKSTVNKYNIPRKYFIIGTPLIIILMIGMAAQTHYRKTGKYDLDDKAIGESIEAVAESFFTYSVIPVKMLDHALEVDLPEEYGIFNLGRATFAGTDYLVCRGIGHITGKFPWSTLAIVQYLQDNRVQILPKSTLGYNYCYTATFYNYLDFGLFGVFGFPFIFSFLFRNFIIKFQRYRNLPDLLIVTFGYFMMLMSLFNCYFIKTWVLLYCAILFLWSEYKHPQFKHIKFKSIINWKRPTLKFKRFSQ